MARTSFIDKKVEQLEKECKGLQAMIDNGKILADAVSADADFHQRLKVAQLDLDSKKLFINFLKTSRKGLEV